MRIYDKSVTEFKIICPECSAVIITAYPETILWERCPQCRRHVWETYDLMMAEVAITGSFIQNRSGALIRTPGN